MVTDTNIDQRAEKDSEITRRILQAIDGSEHVTQRSVADDLGVALGLVNAYLKRCIKKGLIKVRKVPTRRYAYYLTAHGFSEKSRLTVEYLSSSFSFFRRAKSDCEMMFEVARTRGFKRIVLAGVSDLAEITAICALEGKMQIVAVVDPDSDVTEFAGLTVVSSYGDIREKFDAVVVTDLKASREIAEAAIERFGPDCVLVPRLLGVRVKREHEIPS